MTHHATPRRLLAALTVGSVLAGASRALPEDTAPRPLAWYRFEDASQRYKDVPYLFLGDLDLHLQAAITPGPGHALELLWGAKGDVREARVTVNGQSQTVRSGGHDGFRWLRVALPAESRGERYDIVFRRTHEKPAFLAAVRLVAAGGDAAPAAGTDTAAAARLMALSTRPASRPEAFPEMRALWDGEPPPPEHPAGDPELEAAFRDAERNGRRAHEQFFRARRFVQGWLEHADPRTGLIPRNLGRDRDIWNAQDAAADNYPFMVLAAALTDRALFSGRMLDMLRTETRLTSRVRRLPDTWSFSRQAFAAGQPDLDRIIFGASEYVKDGLLPLTEWLGPSPWCERMLGITDDLWEVAPVATPWGKIPSTNVEVCGEMLQALSRLYWMARDERYLDDAIRLGDYFLLGGHHPARDFERLRLRDHGCEVVSGLCELYAAVHFARPEKKKEYEAPIHLLAGRILEAGRDPRGMLYNWIDPRSGEHDQRICDTWGYNYNGLYTVYLIDSTERYREAVRHVLANLPQLADYHWGSADEYADSIEGAINLFNREPVEAARGWIDSEIRDMWSVQRPDGVIEGWHGDGNSARTAIMYALWKTQGLTVEPWREDLRFGAARLGERLCVSLVAVEPWKGKVRFDRPRHRVQMHLPLDYPRINQFPEWFTVEGEEEYVVKDLLAGAEAVRRGEELGSGIAVELEGGKEVRLLVERRRG